MPGLAHLGAAFPMFSYPLPLHVQTSPKLATSPHPQQMSPQSSPTLTQARLYANGQGHMPQRGSPSANGHHMEAPLNLTKPKHAEKKSRDSSSSPSSDSHPAFQPPPAHMKQLFNPELLKRAPFSAAHFVQNPFVGLQAHPAMGVPLPQPGSPAKSPNSSHHIDKVGAMFGKNKALL